ncbi:MAG: hypothetical protein ACC628_20900 [Pirellulaceae bacterium]
MKINPCFCVKATLALVLVGTTPWFGVAAEEVSQRRGKLPDNKQLGSILNNDINNILTALSGSETAPADYKKAVLTLLNAKPGVLAQNVGMPDPVIYRSNVATTWDKYHTEVVKKVWPDSEDPGQAACMKDLLDAGTDPLTLTIEACRERGVPIVASYRMNAEDYNSGELDLYDFGRQHKDLRITGRNCLDPVHSKVFKHRMEIFTEIANQYDIDGIEFDFKRTSHMISDPHKNHVILTRMVAETRKMLDGVARKKGRDRLLLGVRVEPMLEGEMRKADFPGASYGPPSNRSCVDSGLDVKTWIEKGHVDYVCPALFWPRWPGLPNTSEFVELAKDKDVGIYPTLFSLPPYLQEEAEKQGGIGVNDTERLLRYKTGICTHALQLYADGADGISTFNWYYHLHLAELPNQWQAYYGYGMGGSMVQSHLLSILGDPVALRKYLDAKEPLGKHAS